MNTRIGFLKLATLVAVTVGALAPASIQAQTNRGQVVQAVVKLNQAQLAFAKKLAEDAQFASQFDKAAASGGFDAAASLVASATGLAKSSVHVGAGALGGNDDHDAASSASTQSVYQLASFSRPNVPKLWTVTVCIDLIIIRGCSTW